MSARFSYRRSASSPKAQGQSAGEFYTPREVAILMSYILDPAPGDELYDPGRELGPFSASIVAPLEHS